MSTYKLYDLSVINTATVSVRVQCDSYKGSGGAADNTFAFGAFSMSEGSMTTTTASTAATFGVGSGNAAATFQSSGSGNAVISAGTTGNLNLNAGSTSGNIVFSSGSGNINFGGLTVQSAGSLTGTGNMDVTTTGGTVTLASSGSNDIILNAGGDIDANSNVIKNITDPTNAQDAATKSYVDSVASGLDVKESCTAATTAEIATAGGGKTHTFATNTGTTTQSTDAATITADTNSSSFNTIDGRLLVVGERVLLKNQGDTAASSALENGIWQVTDLGNDSSTFFTLRRTADFWIGTSPTVSSGAFTFIEEGTANADTGWVVTSPEGNITVNTDSITFTQFAGAGTVTATDGLTATVSGATTTVKNQFYENAAQITMTQADADIDSITTDNTSVSRFGDFTCIHLDIRLLTVASALADNTSLTITLPASFPTNSGDSTSDMGTGITAYAPLVYSDSGGVFHVGRAEIAHGSDDIIIRGTFESSTSYDIRGTLIYKAA